MKLRIKSDGTRANTVVTDENGNRLDGVKSVSWYIDDDDMGATVFIEMKHIDVDLIGDDLDDEEEVPREPDA